MLRQLLVQAHLLAGTSTVSCCTPCMACQRHCCWHQRMCTPYWYSISMSLLQAPRIVHSFLVLPWLLSQARCIWGRRQMAAVSAVRQTSLVLYHCTTKPAICPCANSNISNAGYSSSICNTVRPGQPCDLATCTLVKAHSVPAASRRGVMAAGSLCSRARYPLYHQ